MKIRFEIEEGVIGWWWRTVRKRHVVVWVGEVAGEYGKEVGEINYRFCSRGRMLTLNQRWLGHNYDTDVITFDYSEGTVVSGDIAIGVETVRENAKEVGVPFENELLRVMIHGVLHLCGLKDKTRKEKVEMRLAEEQALEAWAS
ncbi:MAG: rRNA maturation RNase YbeY [Tannerellaceae bacterium]|jgi:rRNA maturation RNase YbeY|nr:rRNA maturation RNase YbeY [Tannerellaceae bacterium]